MRIEKQHLNSTFFTKEKEGMNNRIEPTLYVDEQAAIPADFCPVCGGERYWPSRWCIRCEGRWV